MAADWIDVIDDAAIRAVVGAETFSRGERYAREGRVRRVSGRSGGALLGEVMGSDRRTYSTLVTPGPGARRRSWAGRCSCPVGADCTHAVAVLIAARADAAPSAFPATAAPPRAGTEGAAASDGEGRADWEARIGRIVRPELPQRREQAGAPLALQVQVVPGRPTDRLLLRPVIRGVRGDWIRAGASRRELEHGFGHYGRPVPEPVHREVMLELLGLQQVHGRGRAAEDRPLYLDEVGPAVWQLLPRLVEVGVQLLDAAGAATVRLAPQPARALVDLRREGPGGDAVLQAEVTVDGRARPAASAWFVGSPVHGVVVDPDGDMLLAGLDEPASPQLGQMLREGYRLDIPADDLPRFLREYYPGLRQVVDVTSSDSSVAFPEVAPPRLALRLDHGRGDELGLAWGFVYDVGGEPVRVPLRAGAEPSAVRDLAAERCLLDALPLAAREADALWSDVDGTAVLAPTTRLSGLATVTFVDDVLPALRETGVEVDAHGNVREYRFTEAAPVIELSTTDSAERDWFDLGVTVTVDGEDIPFEPLFVALARGESHLVLDTGTWFSIERPELEQLRTLIEEARELQEKGSSGLRISAYQADLWDELTRLGVVQEQSERWSRAVQGLLDVHEVPAVDLPEGLDATLRPYQLDGYRWLAFLQDNELGGILADDMGLGKTVQALAMVCRHVERGGVGTFLVVAPTSVVPNWVHEAERFAPGLRVVAVTRTTRASGVPLAELADGADVVVTSYALFRLDNHSYEEQSWAGLLLDEAQFVKNHQGRTHHAARRLRAPFKLAITGTPMENNLMELWSLLSITAPGLYPNPRQFARTVATPVEKGDTEALERLRRRVRPLMRRRTKEQVATELPPKVEQVLEVALNPQHRRIYQTHLQRERQKVLRLIDEPDRNRFAILRSITLLRRLTLDPALVDEAYAGVAASKVDMLVERLREVIDEGHRALVFSQFTGFLATVRRRLDTDGIAYSYLDGSTRDRPRVLHEFRTGTAPVFLISLKAGGVGLNLTEADYCFILDPWWNPAVEAQAVDRTHRIGQSRTVMVYRLVATDTIEDKVMQLKERKLELFSSVMDDGGALAGSLTGEDIAGLLEP